MITNFIMMKTLDKEYTPKNRGLISEDEQEIIKELLKLEERSLLDLRNLRDFVVLWYDCSSSTSEKEEDDVKKRMLAMDKCSAITHLIDLFILNFK